MMTATRLLEHPTRTVMDVLTPMGTDIPIPIADGPLTTAQMPSRPMSLNGPTPITMDMETTLLVTSPMLVAQSLATPRATVTVVRTPMGTPSQMLIADGLPQTGPMPVPVLLDHQTKTETDAQIVTTTVILTPTARGA